MTGTPGRAMGIALLGAIFALATPAAAQTSSRGAANVRV